jgi:formylglycine-generating enzyme required for sulfatase activity
MSGNVAEWTADGYSAHAYDTPAPRNPVHRFGRQTVKRGGSWGLPGPYLRAANRASGSLPATDTGFRLASTP